MFQVTQKLKTGDIRIAEVPLPAAGDHCLIVRNHYSLISAGTEGSTVQTARKGYIGKARERPEQVRQVIQTLKAQGPVQTYRAVMKKLDSHSPLGYSCAGEVIGMAPGVKGFTVGDLVACGGLSAAHAEVVGVPVHLCAKLEPDADLAQAAYNTLGAIALQGVRQADLRLGETCAVIGLGLLGQLTGLLLKVAGVEAVGIDIDPAMVEVAAGQWADLALSRTEVGIEERISRMTGGLGCDAVIITAASRSLDPINFAGAICRRRGTIVLVGNVPAGFDREPHFYKKELQVRMSCSYGPGRYDPQYEEKGVDYPPAYVRWTENRNMRAFQAMLYARKIDVGYLTTHTFNLEEAPAAYDLLMAKTERFIGILIKYDAARPLESGKIPLPARPARGRQSTVNIGFIGAGSYAQGSLLPHIPLKRPVALKGVLTSSGVTSRSVAERFGFEFCTADENDLLANGEINTLFIATRHDSHAPFVIKALKAGKHVFVEKPLCLTEAELDRITDLVTSAAEPPVLMVGYNRRFAALTRKLKHVFPKGPLAMLYRVNAGPIPADAWIQDPAVGGGRIIGEVCHFVDFLTYVNGSLPVAVHASALKDGQDLDDVLNVSLTYRNGSIGVISYLANGDRGLPKERVEVYGSGCTAVLDDFKALTIYANGSRRETKRLNQEKGQQNELCAFVDAILNGAASPVPWEEILSASRVTFKIMESLRTGESVRLD